MQIKPLQQKQHLEDQVKKSILIKGDANSSTENTSYIFSRINKTQSRIDKTRTRIPKVIYKELQSKQTNDFFLTQLKNQQTTLNRCKSQDSIRLQPIQLKKRNVDFVLDDLQYAIKKLKNLKLGQDEAIDKTKLESIDSSQEKKCYKTFTKQSNLKNTQQKDTSQQLSDLAQKKITIDIPFTDQESIDQHLQKPTKSVMSTKSVYNTMSIQSKEEHNEQVDQMQKVLNEGLAKYNQLKKEIENKELKVKQLNQQLQSCINEEQNIISQKNQLKGGNSALFYQLQNLKQQIENNKQIKQSYLYMLKNKKSDLEIVKRNYDALKNLLNSFNQFVDKKSEQLISNTKEIDIIRQQFEELQREKMCSQQQINRHKKDQEIIKSNEQEIIKYMEIQQQSKYQLEELKKIEQRQIKQKQQQDLEQIRQRFKQKQNELQEKDSQFLKIKQQISGIESIHKLIPYYQEIREINKYCKNTKMDLLNKIDEIKNFIVQSEQTKVNEKRKTYLLNPDQILNQQLESTSQKQLESQVTAEKQELEMLKNEVDYFDNIYKELSHFLYNIYFGIQIQCQNEVSNIKEQMGLSELVQTIQDNITNIYTHLEGQNITKEQIETRIMELQDTSNIDITQLVPRQNVLLSKKYSTSDMEESNKLQK